MPVQEANAFSFATSTTAVPFLSLDTTNSRIGILNTAPGATLSVNGTASTSNLTVSLLNAADCDVKASVTGVFSCGTDATGGGGGLNPPLYLSSAARFGIGTSTPGALFSIAATSSTLADHTILYGLDNFVFASSSTSTIPTALNAFSFATSPTAVSIFSLDGLNSRIGVGGTSTPATTLSVAGNTYLDSNVITYSSSTAANLTVSYQTSATSTIPSTVNAWSIATSITATPVISVNSLNSRVGINVASPGAALQVNTSAEPAILVAGSAGNARVQLNPSGSGVAIINVGTSGRPLRFADSSSNSIVELDTSNRFAERLLLRHFHHGCPIPLLGYNQLPHRHLKHRAGSYTLG
ncbi:MAG: hypothetical protein HYT40_01220 [Candidatus Sungbacteria bacterium]|uniref:Uncharacterized protein n=1 Tax=Candidatus Sungiibacteriota bacterium TaxID=2750080 RepID=A0A931WPG9_9BACT|nr:hypothetical protein [Candidatus Sungbacteria bacterium]